MYVGTSGYQWMHTPQERIREFDYRGGETRTTEKQKEKKVRKEKLKIIGKQ